jgi:hypothetical protein
MPCTQSRSSWLGHATPMRVGVVTSSDLTSRNSRDHLTRAHTPPEEQIKELGCLVTTASASTEVISFSYQIKTFLKWNRQTYYRCNLRWTVFGPHNETVTTLEMYTYSNNTGLFTPFSPYATLNTVTRGTMNKQVTNGSKTTVMDVTLFLCVSLGSSTVQLHDSLGSKRSCACSDASFSS